MEKDLTFGDFIENIKTSLGKTEWIVVFSKKAAHKDIDQGGYFSALISNDYVKKSLENYSWDLLIGDGRPGFCTHYEKEKEITEYYRFSNKGIEPFVYWRTFSGAKPDYYEISEEFRLYFDLYEERKGQTDIKLIHIDDNGDDNEVVIIEENLIKVKLSYIKEFLAAKNMHLAIFFDVMRFDRQTLNELNLKDIEEEEKGTDYTYKLYVRDLAIGGTKSQGWLMGKKLIAGLKDFKPDFLGRSEDKKHEDYIIGIDDEGKEILHTSNEDELSNYFGKNPGAPHYLTPIFFKKDVLNKYYDNPEKYEVEDGFVRCHGAWLLRLDNNHAKYVVVFLGDLGRLHNKEQLYWKSFNVAHQGGVSGTAWKRGFKAEFSDPEQPDLYFKYKLRIFKEAWHKKYGWNLFKPLSKGDEHHMKSLHTPATNDQKEFDAQILSLTKIMIDSLNERELVKGLTMMKKSSKGLDKFEAFLLSKVPPFKGLFEFLRNLQSLRSSSVAHRKSENKADYRKVRAFFEMDKKDLPEVFEDIIIKAIWTLNTLENHFLKE